LYLDLTFEDKDLKAPGSYKEYTNKNINYELGKRGGFGGVLVVHTMLDGFKAFDRACPYEAQANTVVEIDEDVRFATCPKCGSKYEIGVTGTGVRQEGVTTYGLRRYNTVLNGSILIIRNY
jgi:hypothetical protein